MPADKAILDTLFKAGLDVPSSCRVSATLAKRGSFAAVEWQAKRSAKP
jgi:hypothetical protein